MIFAIAKAVCSGIENHNIDVGFSIGFRVEKRIDKRLGPSGHDDDRFIASKVVILAIKVEAILG